MKVMRWAVSGEKEEDAVIHERKRRIKLVELSEEMLKEMVQLPAGASIEAIRLSHWHGGAFSLVISHPSFEPVAEGEYVPEIMVMVSNDGGRLAMDWNLPAMEELKP